MKRTISVFIASPSDLANERRYFKEAIKQLNVGFGDGANVEFVPLGWEDTLASTGRRNQDVINKEVDECDVFILVMYRRWGQNALDAEPYTSYTEEEFYRALERWKKEESPEIFVFGDYILDKPIWGCYSTFKWRQTMKTIGFDAPYFTDDKKARLYLEKVRWPNGPICPHCGSNEKHYSLKSKEDSKKPVREGVWKCKKCRKQFSVTVGTVFEKSHIPLNKWLFATFLICSSKKGASAHQLHRMIGVTYKTAWFMFHRIRYAMDQKPKGKMTGTVEADETYVGGKGHGKRGRGAEKKTPVFSLVERNGSVRSMPVERVTSVNLKAIIREHVEKTATIMTDDFLSYRGLGREFSLHHVINHGNKEYVRGNVHTNTIEGYFSILKRGIVGVYQHVGKQHLHRYLSEFDFRYNERKVDDAQRSVLALCGIEGKRLMYRDSSAERRIAM